MAVQARFYVSEMKRQAYNPDAVTITMTAVSRGEHNKIWASATPSGQITMTINAQGAAAYFVDRLGKEIAVSFEEALQDE